MYAIVHKSDGFPVCQQVAGVSPDPVVTWNTEDAAKAFISSKGADADLQPVSLTDEAMDKIAQAMGCAVESDRKSTRLNSSHIQKSRMPSSA